MLLDPIQATRDGLRAELRFSTGADALFAYVSDLRNMEVWWPEHRVYRRVRGDGGVGSLYAWVFTVGVLPSVGFTRVTAHEPAKRFAYRVSAMGLPVHIAYRFEPDGDGTRATFTLRTLLARAPGFASTAVAMVTRAFERLDANVTPR
ncbi:hypothetical protein A7982_13993 [Minicystis rosea]|nr:hypothetical protein A7982_13993 [Minicystis rosea]